MNVPTYITGTIQTTAYRILREHVYGVLAKRELTLTSWALLGVIAQAANGVRQVEIAQALHIKAPQVTLMVKQFETKDIVQSVQNQFDGRAKLLVLTPKGKRFVRAAEAEVNETLRALLDGVTENDLFAYQKVLKTIISNDETLRAMRRWG